MMKTRFTAIALLCLCTLSGLHAQALTDDYDNDYADEQGEVVQYEGEQYIRVSNAHQLLRSFISGKNILVERHTEINLTPLLEDEDWWKHNLAVYKWLPAYGSEGLIGQHIVSEAVTDGRQLSIVGYKDIKIVGEENCSIVVEPRYAFCLNFMYCENITISNLTIGHTVGGYCEGGVIGVTGGQGISLSDCDLYGCGTYGLDIQNTSDFSMSYSCIHDCTYGIMTLSHVEPAVFDQCSFFGNREFSLVCGTDSDISFIECRFYHNNPTSMLFDIDREFGLRDCYVFHPTEALGSIALARQEGNTFNANSYACNIINAEEVKVNFKGVKPTIVDFVNATIGDGFSEEGDCDNWILGWKRYLRTEEARENTTYIVDNRNGYVRIEENIDDSKIVFFHDFCFWNCADGKHKLIAESNGLLDNGKAVETECSGLYFSLYDNDSHVIKYLGMEEAILGSRPSKSNDITYLLPRTGKNITWVDGEGKRGVIRWNGQTFNTPQP